jgi:hemerythrin-like domain-containing protein
MEPIIDVLRRDHREIEALLRILERECERFHLAERPDYELLRQIIDYFGSFLNEYHHPRQDRLLNLIRMRGAGCDEIIDKIFDARATAASSLQVLGDALRYILDDQRVLRQTFDDAARGFIQHERQQIEIEERLFVAASSVLASFDWADLYGELSDQRKTQHDRDLEDKLHARYRSIMRESRAYHGIPKPGV